MQLNLDIHHELIIDNFAGGGGTSAGIEEALGRRVDISINHDPEAVAMHRANHPETLHYCENVWEVNPRELVGADGPDGGRKIGLLWLSPDCKHHSKAKGGKPVEKNIRGLAWVALRYASLPQKNKPRVITLENVEEFKDWGPLAKDSNGDMRPCKKRKGREFNAFCNALRRHGYQVDHRELRACDYGAPTIRKRLFLIARSDGLPIVWPKPTHFDPKTEASRKKQRGEHCRQPWRTAAECIDWSIPCPSIFERKRPLKEATLRRIAKGIMRYVVNTAEPFIVPLTHQGVDRVHAIREPFKTVTGANRGELALCAPVLTEHANASSPRCMPADEPLRTICAQTKGGHHALVSAFIAKHYGGVVGHGLTGEPLHTVTATDHNSLVTAHLVGAGGPAYSGKPKAIDDPLGTLTAENHRALVTSNIVKMRGTNIGQDNREPLHTISAQGTHFAEVRAFLIKYYGTDQDPKLSDPLHTVTTKDRYGLVAVKREEYAIADIGLRMLSPRELFRAQGFREDYIIDHGIDEHGQRIPLTKSAQVRMCGNSVCPPLTAALMRANLGDMAIRRAA